jgi:RNA polymerase sigma factor (sigma-70 family)
MLARLVQAAAGPTPATDAQLLGGFLADRSEAAFEGLVRRHGPMVLAVCRRVLRHHQDAEDAFQATFLVLARRAADVWPRDAVGSWLYGVAYRVALKARAVRARRLTREEPMAENLCAASVEPPSPDLADAIDRAVRKLPEVYRAAVVACDLEGLSRKDAAGQLGWKEGTLSGRLARGRELLAGRLRKAGLTLPAGGIGTALGTADAVSAELLANTVRTAVGSAAGTLAAGVSAPVAVLTEGVVRGMVLSKIKAVAVVVLAAGAIGFGVWSAAGGDPGDGKQPGVKVAPAPAEQAKAEAQPQPPGMADDLKLMQGTWRITSRSDGKTSVVLDPKTDDPRLLEVTIRDSKLIMPYLDLTEGVKRVEYTIFRLDPSKKPKEIDLVSPRGVAGKGIYQIDRTPGSSVLKLAIGPARAKAFGEPGEGGLEFTLVPADQKPNPPAADLIKEAQQKREIERQRAAADVEQAQADLEVATAELRRAEALRTQAQAKLDVARARLKALQEDLPMGGPKVFVRDDAGRDRPLTEDQAGRIASLGSAMLGDCTGELAPAGKGPPFATAELWQKLKQGGHVRITFAGARVFKGVGGRPEVTAEEILIPTSANRTTTYLLTRHGTTYQAFFGFRDEHATELRTVLANLK